MNAPWRAAILYDNLADAGAVSASAAAPLLPASQLQSVHMGRKWRALTNTASVRVDLLSVQPVDTISLLGTNLTASAAYRVRVSTTDPEAQMGVVFDTMDRSDIDAVHPDIFALADEPAEGRYVRIDMTDDALTFLEAARVVVGQRHQFGINYGYGWGIQWVDRSRITESRGGSLFVDREKKYRMANLPFEHIKPSDRYGVVEDVDREAGTSRDVLFFTNPDSDRLGRDTIWGLIEQASPTVEAYYQGFSKTYTIRERL